MLLLGMGVMGRFNRPLPLPAPYPILPLPDWGLVETKPELKVATAYDQIRIFFLPTRQVNRSSWVSFILNTRSAYQRTYSLSFCTVVLDKENCSASIRTYFETLCGLISPVRLAFWDVGVITSKSRALKCFMLGCSAVLRHASNQFLLPLTIIQRGSSGWTFPVVSVSVSWPGRWVVAYPSSPAPLLNLVLFWAQGHEQFERDCNWKTGIRPLLYYRVFCLNGFLAACVLCKVNFSISKTRNSVKSQIGHWQKKQFDPVLIVGTSKQGRLSSTRIILPLPSHLTRP